MPDKSTSSLADFVARYDTMILHPNMRALYAGADFYNVGDWSGQPATLSEACEALVRRHLDENATTGQELGPPAPLCILDVGCGLGAGAEIMVQHYRSAQVIGINISHRQVEYARRQHPQARYCVMDATRLPLLAGRFDRVISIEAAFHFSPRADFLHATYRLLKPGGRLILTDILFQTTEWVGEWSVPASNRVENLAGYAHLCENAGFCIDSLEDITEATWIGFCRYLRDRQNMRALADHLESSVSTYLMAHLRHP